MVTDAAIPQPKRRMSAETNASCAFFREGMVWTLAGSMVVEIEGARIRCTQDRTIFVEAYYKKYLTKKWRIKPKTGRSNAIRRIRKSEMRRKAPTRPLGMTVPSFR